MRDIVGTIYLPCPECGQLRTRHIRFNRYTIGRALRTICPACAGVGTGGASLNATELAEEIAFIGGHPEQVARQLGTTPAAIARRFYRAGMPEQARPFERVVKAARDRRAAA